MPAKRRYIAKVSSLTPRLEISTWERLWWCSKIRVCLAISSCWMLVMSMAWPILRPRSLMGRRIWNHGSRTHSLLVPTTQTSQSFWSHVSTANCQTQNSTCSTVAFRSIANELVLTRNNCCCQARFYGTQSGQLVLRVSLAMTQRFGRTLSVALQSYRRLSDRWIRTSVWLWQHSFLCAWRRLFAVRHGRSRTRRITAIFRI
jgi:hypothetical protein